MIAHAPPPVALHLERINKARVAVGRRDFHEPEHALVRWIADDPDRHLGAVQKLLDERRAAADIRAAHAHADVVIAFLHWGVQFQPRPTEDQRRLARALIDAGAGAVVGSHPHVTQGAETYRGCPIVYSLGDFLFDFEDPAKVVPEALTNWMLRLTLDKRGVVAWDTVVSRTDRAGVPQPVAGRSGPTSGTPGK